MAVAPIFVGTPKNGHVQIVNADGTAQKTAYTAGASGSKVVSLMAQSTDTSARNLTVSITNGGTSYPLGTVNIPIGAGSDGTAPAVDLLAGSQLPGLPVDSDGNHYILLVSGDTLTVAALVAVTAAKTVTVVAIAGDF